MDSKDLARPVAFFAKMVAYRPLALQLVREGLLSSNIATRLLGGLSPKEVILDFLMIVSDLARMSKVNLSHKAPLNLIFMFLF